MSIRVRVLGFRNPEDAWKESGRELLPAASAFRNFAIVFPTLPALGGVGERGGVRGLH